MILFQFKSFMKFRSSVILSLILTFNIFPQQFVYQGSIDNFRNASGFSLSSSGFFYVTDTGSDEVTKLDTLGNILKDAGGYGWTESIFDFPSDVFATPLNVYVCDKNNNRIERFDKDLNYISQLFTRNNENSAERFGYPLSCATSNQGDLYILDSENKRVVKFNLFGQYVQDFGGFDAGAFSLTNPKKLAVSSANNIYVLDDRRLLIFDQFGSGIKILNLDENFINLNIVGNNFVTNSLQNIYSAQLPSRMPELQKVVLIGSPRNVFVSSLIAGNKLYVLVKNEIMIFKKT